MSDLLDKPWRPLGKDPWNKDVYKTLKDEIVTHELLDRANIEYFNVLLIGQVSSGKSSFYNTVESVFAKNVTLRAGTGTREESLTTQFRTFKVKAKDSQNQPIRFRFCDTMGLSGMSGLKPEDYGKIMDGNVRDGADLRGKLVPSVKGYNENPTTGDKMHCVAFIVDASSYTFIDEQILEKFNKIRDEADSRFLNPIVILTRIDQTCIDLKRDEGDVRNVFHSKTMKDAVEEVAQKFGVAENSVYPVQNYSVETEKDRAIDILALRTLRQILRCSETFLDDMLERQDEDMKQLEEQLSNMKQNQTPTRPGQKFKQAPAKPGPTVKQARPPPATFCTSLYNCKGEDDDELDMSKGEKFTVMKLDLPGGWTLIKNQSGSTGKAPTNWLQF